MLVRLRLEEIPKYWELIHDSLVTAVHPVGDTNPEHLNHVLMELLAGSMQAWAVFNPETREFSAMLVTSMFEDLPTKVKNLVMYSFTAYRPMTAQMYVSCFEALKKFGRAAGCTRIIAYTDNERYEKILLKLSGQLGGMSCRFVAVPLC